MHCKARPQPEPEGPDHGLGDLVASYGQRIEKMGRGFRQRHMPALGAEDLAQAGYIAMLGAAKRFDPTRGVPFGAFLQTRLKGAMRDALRVEARQSKRDRMESPSARQEPGERDLAAEIVSHAAPPGAGAERRKIAAMLTRALDVLSPRERRIIIMVYVECRTQREVGELMHLTPGRICQLQSGACAKMREYFRLMGILSASEFV